MERRQFHPTSLAPLVTAVFLSIAAFQAAQPSTSVFTILSRGQVVGIESVTVTKTADGELISATGGLGPPMDLTTNRFQLRYDAAWRPVSVAIEGSQSGQRILLDTIFANGTARTTGMQRGQPVDVTHQISPQTIVLPTDHYAAYEALAEQLASAQVGSQFRLYMLGIGEINSRVDAIVPHRLATPQGTIELREFDMTFANRIPLPVEVWIDDRGRLARFAVPASWLVVIRDDISSVMTREEKVTRGGDQEAFIPSTGFELAATLSKPNTQLAQPPVVVLVGAVGRQDRDEQTGGVPVFGRLAGALADRGFLAVRYDQRGIGRSGGRVESATLSDYADDALNVVKWLRNRRDLDRDRIAMIGYGQGAALALLAAKNTKNISAVSLLSAAGQTGREITLAQQQHALARSNETEALKRAKIDLQTRVIDAVIKGTGWENVPPEIRNQADIPSFRTWLTFNPATIIPKVKQPLLILTGALDTEFPPAEADRLEALARVRKTKDPNATKKVIVPGVNHLLVAARTGEQDEYASLANASVAPTITAAIADWLDVVMAPKRKQ